MRVTDLSLVRSHDVSVLAKFAEALNLRLNRSKPEPEVLREEHKSTPLTEQEQIEAINARVAEVIRKGLADRGILPSDPGYSDQVKRATYAVNSVAGRKAGECRTVEEAEARLRAALSLWEQVS